MVKILNTARVILLLVGCSLTSGLASAQVQIQTEEKEAVAEAPAATTVRSEDKIVKENEEKYAGGAALKTDSDLEDQLKKAATFVAEKNYRYATILWDRVLEKSDNSLVTRDGETYISLVRQVEETIRNLPPNGLQVYRISADGKAKALMPGSPAEADLESLNKLVRLYFMSSIGDEAAFELGCRALDQRDFVSASRLFNKVLSEHPDPSVDRNEVLIRQAIAAGNLGDQNAAQKALESVEANADDSTTALARNVRQHLEFLSGSNGSVSEGGVSISMRLSGPTRSGVMPDLPDNVLSGDLTQGYEFRFPFVFATGKADADLGKIIRGGATTEEATDKTISTLSQKWKSEKWFPANQLLYADGRLVLKTTNDLVCIDATGKSNLPIWHSLWLNLFELDEASWNAKTYGQQMRNRNGSPLPINFPNDENESWYFYDRIRQSMAIHQGVVYTIEGQNYSQLDDSVPRTRRSSTTRSYNQPVNLVRSRTNFLTAYDLRTGKVLWTRSAFEKSATTEEEDGTQGKVGFLGTPVPFGNLILCPVTEGGAISVYAMDTKNKGKIVWKTFLCDDPTEGVDFFAPVELTIAGQDAYVSCGTGVLFALNASTGNVQFARRYTRDGKKTKIQTSYNQSQQILIPDGWDDNIVVTWKNALIVMAADHDYVFAIDRRNGKNLWDAPRLPFDEEVSHAYCLGHHNDKLIMATNKAVLCYNLAGDGKLHWYQKLGGNSYGRGFITSRAVFIPVEDSIIKFDLNTGKKIAQVGVNLGSETKVGNLFSDGRQIWVAGMNRVVSLRSLRDRLAELKGQIDAGSEEALQERMKIYARLEEHEQALGDAIRLFELTDEKVAAYQQLVRNMNEVQAFTQAPVSAFSFLDKLLANKQLLESLKSTISQDYQVFFQAADSAQASREQEVVNKVLNWSGYALSNGFDSAVSKFLAAHPPAANALNTVVETGDARQIKMLIPVVAKLDAPSELLKKLAGHEAEDIQMAAANELALLGDKACLRVAHRLLSSETQSRRLEAYLVLKNVTGAEIPFKPDDAEGARTESIAKWKTWLDENEESLQVKLPVELRFGKVLIGTASKILELDLANGLTKIAEVEGYNPEDLVTARNGNRIVAEYSRQKITEVDLSGKVVQQISTTAFPRSVRKLSNGNYLVTWRNQTKPVVELDGQGRTVWEAKNLSGFAHSAERLSSGNTLVAFEKRVVEIDADSNVVFEIGAAQGVSGCREARRLSNGNTMVVYGTYVAIFDKNKNPVLRIRGSFKPTSAVQLKDGRILVAHNTGIRVYDKEGTKVGDDLINEHVNSVWDY